MARWVRIATIDQCPPGHGLEAVADGRIVALFNVAGTLHAVDGVCPHQGGPLGRGELDDAVVTCPWHGWQFDVREGRCLTNATIRQQRWNVMVEKEAIYVDVESAR